MTTTIGPAWRLLSGTAHQDKEVLARVVLKWPTRGILREVEAAGYPTLEGFVADIDSLQELERTVAQAIADERLRDQIREKADITPLELISQSLNRRPAST